MAAKAKKKFPALPRPRSRKPSEDSPVVGVPQSQSERGHVGGSRSSPSTPSPSIPVPRSRSYTPRALRGRKPSFRGLGRRRSKSGSGSEGPADADSHGNGVSVGSGSGSGGPAHSDESSAERGVVDVGDDDDYDAGRLALLIEPRPLPPALPSAAPATSAEAGAGRRRAVPPTPRSSTSAVDSAAVFDYGEAGSREASAAPAASNAESSNAESSDDGPPPPATRGRSLTPSDCHYHTAPNGGVNAPLTPLSAHYATNRNLLDLFSTLYEKGQYSVAYAVGVKFVEVALFQIPAHGYYKSARGDSKGRTRSAADAVRVTRMLGGIVDEVEVDGGDRDAGAEKAERLNRLSDVAKRSFEEALDIELKEGREARRGEENASPMARLWNDYVVGRADDGPGGANGICSIPDNICSLPDNICSYLNNLGRGGEGRDGPAATDRRAKKKPKVEGKRSVGGAKKAKVQRVPEKMLPEPVVIPQVFIPRPESRDAQLNRNPLAKKEDTPPRDAVMDTVARKVSSDTSDSCVICDQEVVLGDAATEEEDNFVGEKPQIPPGPISTGELEDTPMEDAMYNKPMPVAMDKETEGDTEVGTPLVEDVEPLEQRQADDGGLNKEVLQLALSLSASMQEEAPVEVAPEVTSSLVSSSSSSEGVSSTMSVDGRRRGGSKSKSRISSLVAMYDERYRSLRDGGNYHVRFLDTFQGRNPLSTNGCTVIAPLMCIQYFCSDEGNVSASSREQVWEGGVPDELINHVIDDHAAAVLPDVRRKLDLDRDAFIIPSDVHDHLIEVGLLSTSQFVGVCGGNILDDNHLASFKSALFLLDDKRERERLRGRKVAATFFFHGHVVALHVVQSGDDGDCGGPCVELIDSLPNPETWVDPPSERRPPLGKVSPDSMDCDGGEDEWRDPSNDGEWERLPSEDGYEGYELPQNAVRVRCTDVDGFDVLLRHYACSKFSEEERAFIDRTAWDDSNCYCDSAFDPRIFQAFIWSEAA